MASTVTGFLQRREFEVGRQRQLGGGGCRRRRFAGDRAGVDLLKQFRPKFTDFLLPLLLLIKFLSVIFG
jgi:hypothetical protein